MSGGNSSWYAKYSASKTMIPEINLLPNEISPVTTFFSHAIFMDCMSPGLCYNIGTIIKNIHIPTNNTHLLEL